MANDIRIIPPPISSSTALSVASLTIGGLVWTVTLGANDSGGTGYRTVTIKVPNA